jgi:hypothetical protein
MQSALGRRGRKRTAEHQKAVGSARPDSKARRVGVNSARAILKQPNLSDTEVGNLLDCMYSFADVIVQAFIERRSRETEVPAFDNMAEAAIASHLLTSPIAA